MLLMNSSVTCRVFSAKTFYSQYPRREALKESYLTYSLPQFQRGIHGPSISNDRSLSWIDGLYGDTRRAQSFINSLINQEVPFPLSRPLLARSKTNYYYYSPELLHKDDSSLLALWNGATIAVPLLQKECRIDCPTCGSEGLRTPTPTHLAEQIAAHFSGAQVRLCAHSTSESLHTWALDHGFQVRIDDSTVFWITLDTVDCTHENLATLSRILTSLWRLPDVTLTCSSTNQEISYYKTGWCEHCSSPIPYPDDKTIVAYLRGSRSLEPASLHLLRGLYISSSLSLLTFLTTPMAELTDYPYEFTDIVERMTQIGLSHRTLQTSASHLSAQEVAALSIAIASHKTTPGSTILIDLPAGLLSSRRESILPFLTKLSAECAVVLIQDPFLQGQGTPHIGQVYDKKRSTQIGAIVIPSKSRELPVHSHSVLSISAKDTLLPSLSSLVTETPTTTHLRLTAEGSSIATLPVFATVSKGSSQTLADVLGLSASLSKLFSMGLDAKYLGLSPRDFLSNTVKRNQHICPHCRGLGVVLSYQEEIHRPEAEGCSRCDGQRFAKEVARCTFKGVSYSSLLNSTILGALPILTTLPKVTELLRLLDELQLSDLPLGMPLALMSYTELRRIRFIEILINLKKTLPNVVLVEEPLIGWSPTILSVVEQNMCRYAEKTATTWILVDA